jgi:serine O-acetyltransferase
MFNNLSYDLKRYTGYASGNSKIKKIFYTIFEQGVWAIVIYRLGSWCSRFKFPILSLILKIFYFLLNKIIEITTGISISSKAQIGKGFYIGHCGGIFIHPNVKIGENFNIGQGVTIGTLGMGKTGVPKLGNNVYIGAGAKLLGGITIGDNVKIGANAVVINDIPDNATAVGIPAKVVKTNG